MHAELARRRVYVHPVRWTSLGLSLLEAMHLGMPVVALATTEAVEAVPPEAGVLSTRPERLCDAVRAFVDDPDAARLAGKAARAAALGALRAGAVPADWDRAAGGGDPMKIDLVSRARQPAGRDRRRRRRRAERARRRAGRRPRRRAATRSPCTPAATTPALPERVRHAGRLRRRARARRAGRARCPRTTCCRTCRTFADVLRRALGAPRRPTSCTRTSG